MSPTWDAAVPQWSPAFGAGKSHRSPNLLRPGSSAAMEPSFWSWEKGPHRRGGDRGHPAAMEPSFWSWEKSRPTESSSQSVQSPQWSPAFGAGKRSRSMPFLRVTEMAAMEPSFWSWEKGRSILVHGKGGHAAMEPSFWSWEKGQPPHLTSKPCLRAAMEPSFWSWEKPTSSRGSSRGCAMPQWSPAFGAGKRARDFFTN